MILLFGNSEKVFAIDATQKFNEKQISSLSWLFSNAKYLNIESIDGKFIGPRREMITPWSTNAVEITQNMGLEGILRIEEFFIEEDNTPFDPMLNRRYTGIDQSIFTIDKKPDPIVYIENIAEYNKKEGLALNSDEIAYLESVAARLERSLTDSEVFGFSQVNSEHCRHKIFNGEFIIDGEVKPDSLFKLIKKTTKTNPNQVTSAYTDNCAFLQGPMAEQFAPKTHDTADFFEVTDFESVISIKAETHNFPTTVEPFNGAATGTGGEIRDRIAGGKGAFPVAGTAVYMTAYPRLEDDREWEKGTEERKWLYQTPKDILIKASNGASDFGNKFGQPLICGSLLTFEHSENGKTFGYDKVIMQAGGVGYGKKIDSMKDEPTKGDKVVLLGGDNYRIGMGGGAVSSVATGEYTNDIELNAIQRSNPEMQKRAYNAIRAISEEDNNPIISIHDHGAGGHLNCLSELVEATGGRIDIDKLPIGDPTLSGREIAGNESQERMGLVIDAKYIDKFTRIADRERSPINVIGEATGDMQFTFVDNRTGEKPIDWPLADMFGKVPKTILNDKSVVENYDEVKYDTSKVVNYIENILQLESVACKDWLTNKVDRSVTGRVAMQQTAGSVQVPLNDCAVVAMDYQGKGGIATALGHAPLVAMIDPAKGSVMAIAESLTNIVFAPLAQGIKGISLSANWMWPCKNDGEDARLYKAVEAASDFAIELGINIPTGKDSLSMTQKYRDGELVYAPGTVIITSVAEVSDVKQTISPALKHTRSEIVYVDLSNSAFALGGSCFAQIVGKIGTDVPTVDNPKYFAQGFEAVQALITNGEILAGHDISGGGLITALLEMTFADNKSGIKLNLDSLNEKDLIKLMFSEKPSIVLQVESGKNVIATLKNAGVNASIIGEVNFDRVFEVNNNGVDFKLDINHLRDLWFKSSYLLDKKQSGDKKALERYTNYKNQELNYKFPENFKGTYESCGIDPKRRVKSGLKAAIIREKGGNGDREMAWAMFLAGMDVKDVHMTDLVNGRETLEDINLIVFVGGFSNSDVLGSAKGWAGAFLYNEKAKLALDNFFARPNTMSLGICNGCQLMVELNLITPDHTERPKMLHNDTHKFESNFVGVDILPTSSIMLETLTSSKLGVWIAHGEGKFSFPYAEEKYNIAAKYSYAEYPANPNGSDYSTAAIVSADGRHLAMMPHPERAISPWNWAYYPEDRKADEVTPWIEMFVNAAKWIKTQK